MLHLNLSSQIVLNKIPEKFYRATEGVEYSQITRMEKIHTLIYPKAEEGARYIASQIAATINQRNSEGHTCVLALGTGLTLTPVYAALVNLYNQGRVSFARTVVCNAYEYFPLKPGSAHSSIAQLRKVLLSKVDVPEQNVLTPDATVPQSQVQQLCRDYIGRLNSLDGIDVALLGIGRMGNIATNEPGSMITSTARLMLLDPTAREEMTKSFGSQEPVPPCAITLGVADLLKARTVYLVAWGDAKAGIIQQTVEEHATDAIPASFLQTHNNAHVVVDLPAAARLTRIVHPWLVSSCHWTDKLTRAALVWLCRKLHKPILKLTNKDYNENHLSELLALYGSAYNANIKIFNDLQHTITGWPGGKPGADDSNRPERALPYPKRVVVFSPHPDDDVISMGGTLRRLVQQGHEVHVAYETSGNIAVSDSELMRYMHFLNGFNQLFLDNSSQDISSTYRKIKNFLAQKQEGEPDTRAVLTLKALIRRGEARMACAYNQLPSSQVHFLDLPFYESGRVEKLPMTGRDVDIVRQLLQQIKPHQIFVAGDLADPHDTHRKCTDAVLAAIDLERQAGAEWLNHCRVWMYRGAWSEWEIENIEMCVPMSPEELRAKRNAILKHCSQMEGAPYLGNDERLFWQRAEDRNHATAQIYDELGLACYEAMEAFVEYKL